MTDNVIRPTVCGGRDGVLPHIWRGTQRCVVCGKWRTLSAQKEASEALKNKETHPHD